MKETANQSAGADGTKMTERFIAGGKALRLRLYPEIALNGSRGSAASPVRVRLSAWLCLTVDCSVVSAAPPLFQCGKALPYRVDC
jgi:hypothetical protein